MLSRFDRAVRESNFFLFLLGYRWLSLLPPALSLIFIPATTPFVFLVLGVALVENSILTTLHPFFNRQILRRPLLFGLDLIIVAALVALTGGDQSPYYLYALSPILAAAYFFQLRGGLAAAGAITPLYLAALWVSMQLTSIPPNPITVAAEITGFFLLVALFSFPSALLKQLQNTARELERAHVQLLEQNGSLERAHRELESVHGLTLAMQSSATDVADIQEKILATVTHDLEFERAILGLVAMEQNALTGWLVQRRAEPLGTNGLAHAHPLPLHEESGLLAQAVLNGNARYVADAAAPTTDATFNAQLGLTPYALLPLAMRDHSVGVLLVDNPASRAPISPVSFESLVAVANQAALALGSTKMCVERAQRLAVEQERNRIAMEIHDTATQSLFGVVYTLDAYLKELPPEMETLRQRLQEMRDAVQCTLQDLRQSIHNLWTNTRDAQAFVGELRAHLRKLEAPATLQVEIETYGDMQALDDVTRKNLLRIAEEGLTNVVKHADATRAQVLMYANVDETKLVVEDNGRGISPDTKSGFGLTSINERARALDGRVTFGPRVGGGTRLSVVVRGCTPVVN